MTLKKKKVQRTEKEEKSLTTNKHEVWCSFKNFRGGDVG